MQRTTSTLLRRLVMTMAMAFLIAGSTGVVNADDTLINDDSVVASFVEHVESVEASDALKKAALDKVKELESSAIDAITEGLIELYPDYAAAVNTADGDDLESAVKLLTPLTTNKDRFLAADASFLLARSLMNAERYEEAIPQLDSLQGDLKNFSVHGGVTDYFKGLAFAGTLNNDAAIQSFVTFLKNSPDAPERMRVSAWRQAQRLQEIKEGELNDVHQLMDFSRRRLKLAETDDKTQEQQDAIIKKLTLLIKKEEKKECSSSCKNCKKPGEKPKPDQQQAKKESKPKQDSKSKQAGKSNVQAGEAIVKNYDDSPASAWSRLRERSRDPANNAIKENLPAKYRDIVEKFMDKANGGSGN